MPRVNKTGAWQAVKTQTRLRFTASNLCLHLLLQVFPISSKTEKRKSIPDTPMTNWRASFNLNDVQIERCTRAGNSLTFLSSVCHRKKCLYSLLNEYYVCLSAMILSAAYNINHNLIFTSQWKCSSSRLSTLDQLSRKYLSLR